MLGGTDLYIAFLAWSWHKNRYRVYLGLIYLNKLYIQGYLNKIVLYVVIAEEELQWQYHVLDVVPDLLRSERLVVSGALGCVAIVGRFSTHRRSRRKSWRCFEGGGRSIGRLWRRWRC